MHTMGDLADAAHARCATAWQLHGPTASSHEGYAILLEEVDELWDEVKKKQDKRSKERMREECIDIAAAALRFAYDLCQEEE